MGAYHADIDMSATTHPLTYIHPACGKPAFHRTRVPVEKDAVMADDHENLDGTPTKPTQDFKCQSCGHHFRHWAIYGDIQQMLDAANYIKREV